ncbi:MAG TPA: hypothetical protein VFA21_20530 [Pyrinomonadaceae bacterium]|jgi:hypothetical protein|nr:hypothetical protein [Pyrinomonadaceae bacterium]
MPNALRGTMSDLIAYVRRLTGDAAGANQIFADTDVQDALDAHRLEIRYEILRAQPTVPPGGYVSSASYKDYFSVEQYWEADVVLYDSSYTALTPAASDLLVGHWTFTSGQLPPVYAVGKSYDVYAAAVDLLEEWAAKEKLNFDFTTDGQTFRESQKSDALLALAARYARKMRCDSAPARQSDFVTDGFDFGMAYR